MEFSNVFDVKFERKKDQSYSKILPDKENNWCHH